MTVISRELGLVYVRVPRTASSTFVYYLTHTLGDLVEQITPQHASARELRSELGPIWERSHTFGFVRNPWEWLVSMYNANISVSVGEKEPIPGRTVSGEGLSETGPVERANMPFEDWVRARHATPMDWFMDGDEIIVDEIRLFEAFVSGNRIRHGGKAHAPYRAWYDDDLAAYVAEKCRREIDAGGYRF